MSTNLFLSAMVLAGFGFSDPGATPGKKKIVIPVKEKADTTRKSKPYRDLYSDTWVATDAIGRTMPGIQQVGPVKNDQKRVVGIFYITWHRDHHHNKKEYEADVTKVLSAHPEARMDAKHPAWKAGSFHWGEPEMGYFLSKDEYVVRKDMSMLTDAGVDVLIMDVTNAEMYWDEWEVVFSTMEKMKAEGSKVPKFCFWAFNGEVIPVVQRLYERIYLKERFKDLWYYWDDKPLLLYNSNPRVDANGVDAPQRNYNYDSTAKTNKNHLHYNDPEYTEPFYKDYTRGVKSFFTLRTMWWGYYEWAGKRFIGTEDNWSFGYDLDNKHVKQLPADSLVSLHKGKKEEAAVTPAQHPASLVGKSWTREKGEPSLNQYDLPEPTYVPWLGKTVENPEGYGIYFQDRWDEALKEDPQFLYINDWNEWTAGKYQPKNGTTNFLRRKNPYFFVDQYNAEFNRAIQPMKGGYTDNYYMQMAQNIRKYKGVRPIPTLNGYTSINLDGKFADWKKAKIEYRDTEGDVFHRDYIGYGDLQYTNNSGRNDIITSKVAVDKQNINFYVATANALTPHTGNNWMLLLIDADNNSSTGWNGYDYMINKQVKDDHTTTLMRYDGKQWIAVADLSFRYSGSEMEIAVPRQLLGLTADKWTFDFKWSDNPADLEDVISLALNGDTAPNRRFNYRCIWSR
ncbi:hypothetical protein DVR12_23970 [Chitinophaga silvatica]|uniref:Uncharacterized protein n=1 Tax=Chitinophaga silvatica TaxID=2282649 RepID=A0A3E1Y3N5_9BACT|nr:hypothetical protein [Chitinophaga silvatica]RFS19294.1 hypothetical protein DVR12_23970 [Chitinophaga silvatica]